MQHTWRQEAPHFWRHEESQWVVRDYNTHSEIEDAWVILDAENMMVSCEWKPTKEECMREVEVLFEEELNENYSIE